MAAPSGPTGYTRALRCAPFFAFAYSLCLSIPYATEFRRAIPAIGLVFLAASVVQSLLVLRSFQALRKIFRPRKYEYRIVLGDSPPPPPPPPPPGTDEESNTGLPQQHQNDGFRRVALSTLLVLSDGSLAFLHALVFSLTILEMTAGWNSDHSDILGTFASLAYLAAFSSHTVLGLAGLYNLSTDIRFRDLTHCPHCNKSVFGAGKGGSQETAATTQATTETRVHSEPGPETENSAQMTGAWSQAAVSAAGSEPQLVDAEA